MDHRSVRAPYLPETAMVTPGGVETLPTCTDTGTAPAVRPLGICTLTWVSPATLPGAPPAYCAVKVRAPRVTVTDAGTSSLASGVSWPSTLGGVVWPVPVRKRSERQ